MAKLAELAAIFYGIFATHSFTFSTMYRVMKQSREL